ncbi:MAG: T9SS type A sorting domain-containing protein, partial [Bacteroidota bacterium]
DGWVLVSTQGNGIFSCYYNPVGIGDNKAADQRALGQNFPNPASATTNIKFTNAENEHLQLILYSQEGKQVKVLLDQFVPAGTHAISVATDHLRNGIYYYRLISSFGSVSRKMVVAK